MAALRAFGGGLAACLVLWAGFAQDGPLPIFKPPAITQVGHEASLHFALPADWIAAMIKVKSAGNPSAVSSKEGDGPNAYHARNLGIAAAAQSTATDPYDVHDNVVAGTALLRELCDRFGASGFLAVYNVGPSRYLSFLNSGVPLNEETRTYL